MSALTIDNFTAAQQVLLVVYAVLWAGILPTFGRLRAFAINGLFSTRTPDRSRRLARFLVAVVVGNLAPAALLVALLRWLPDPGGWPGVFVAALAGVSPAVFPRLLHTFVASDRFINWYYPDPWERGLVLSRWDPTPTRTNTFASHLLASVAILPLTLGLAWGLGAVLTATPETASEALPPDWGFFGVVADVAHDGPLVDGAGLHRGGPDSQYRAGALTMAFQDGHVIEVPAGTPGGNWCRDLATSGARNEECVIAGAFDESGAVAWFEVLDVVNTSPDHGGGRHVEVFGIERLDGDHLIIRGLSFEVRGDSTVDCPGDASNLTQALSSGRPLMADVSTEDSRVINVWCVYRA